MNSIWYIPTLRGVLGDWVYYSALLKPEHFSSRIKPSHEIREAKALEDFLQRTLKPRVAQIASYLGKRDSRFFNSIIVGIFGGLPSWAEFDLKAVTRKLRPKVVTDELKESLGLLIFTGDEKMFAIDGQHRVEGIKEAYRENPERLRHDQYPVIFVAHLDTPDGKVRTRRLFCDINKNAVAVAEGDKVVIDEDDISAIVTRRIYANYPAFKGGKEIAVTERKEILERDGKERFTSLLALYTVTKKLKRLFRKKAGTLESDLQNVPRLEPIVTGFFDFVIEREPSLNKYFKQRRTTLAAERKNNRNLLFRPVGLEVLARLYAYFHARGGLSRLAEGLTRLNFQSPHGVFDGILWSDGKIAAGGKEKSAAVDLCLYMLGELDTGEKRELLLKLREITKNMHYQLPSHV